MRVFILALIMAAHSLFADASAPYSGFLKSQIEKTNWTLQSSDDGATEVCTERGDWFQFRRFYLSIRPNVTFTIGVATLAIVPEITIMWEKALPEDWEPYRP